MNKSKYMLESFYYLQQSQIPMIKKCDMFLFDCGVFTFLQSKNKSKIDFEKYNYEYAQCINKYDFDYFFELDIDSFVGYSEVKRLRRKLENKTSKKCIPVWHKTRGIEEWRKMITDYDYVAIAGFAHVEIKPNEYVFVKRMLKEANVKRTKVHGLGYTRKDLEEWDWYSVDSSSWKNFRFGNMHKYNTKKKCIETITRPAGYKMIDYKLLGEYNIEEWVKYQTYLDRLSKRRTKI